MQTYPLKFEPIFKKRIWGGQRLREFFGKDIPPFEKIGESWELSDLPEDKSIIVKGKLAGESIHSVIEKYPKAICGDEKFSGPFPLLIKFLDAQDILSVQVHPDAETCLRMGKGNPKTECWYIIDAIEGAFIYKGLRPGVSREEFGRAIRNGSVEEMLLKVPVKAGECHFLPAGTTHSIGSGLLIAEIQTPSDTTYRVFDWNRVDDTGKPRPLHIEEALESIHFDASSDDFPVTTVGRLVDCEFFKIDKGHQSHDCELLFSAGKMKILIILTGFGVISGDDGDSVEFKAGDTLLIPAEYEGAAQFVNDTEYLTVTL